MAVFNTNQVRHLYVAKSSGIQAAVAYGSGPDAAAIKAADAGTIWPIVDNASTPTEGYFIYKGKGGVLRSDLIKFNKSTYYTAIDPANDKYTLKAKRVTLKSDVNGGDPVAGQDYILGLEIKGFVSGFEEDTYTKHGMVHAFSNMDAATFYNVLALSLWMNFSRETSKFFTFWLDDGSTPEMIDDTVARRIKAELKSGTITNQATSLIIQEAPMDWSLGRMQEEHLFFDVSGDTIVFNGDELEWATIEDVAAADINTDPDLGGTEIVNSHRIADLEYFCMGERNTLYRGMDWPNSIFDPSMLMVDPTNTTGYYVFNLHYAFVDSREGSQRSEKDLQIVCPSALTNLTNLMTAADVKEVPRK